MTTKGKCVEEGTFFAIRFPSLGNFVKKKVGFRKKQSPPSIQLLNITKVGLVFSISNFVINKISQERKHQLFTFSDSLINKLQVLDRP